METPEPGERPPTSGGDFYADGDPGPIVAALAHVPELCEVALPFIGGALGPSAVSFRHKEIAILRTSANLACKFCVNAHTVVAFDIGLSHSEVRALRGETQPAPSFSDEGELALIEWIDALSTGTGGIDPRLGKAVASAFGQHQLVELTVQAAKLRAVRSGECRIEACVNRALDSAGRQPEAPEREALWQTARVSEPVRNRRRPSELTDADVEAVLDRIRTHDAELAQQVEHVLDTLTWGEGPAVIRQAGVQEWLWYVVPTKYMTDEPGYMGALAQTAAVLFDELGLHGYAAICRSEETAKVHAAFDQSDRAGRTALQKATERSGIDPPGLDDFEWSSVMRTEEVQARFAVQAALEEAIYTGEMTVGAKGWRQIQARVCRNVLDGDHPDIPGQSWRTAVVTERIEQWVSAAESRSPMLGEARAQIANQLLHPIDMPSDAATAMRSVVWLLEQWGDEQPMTQAGYLKPAFVQSLQADRPWSDAWPLDRPVKTELDDAVLHELRGWLQRIGALRKHKATLRRTPLGREIVADPADAWHVLTRNLAGGDDWDSFVAETGLLYLLDKHEPVSDSSPPVFIRNCAIEMGWQTTIDAVTEAPSLRDVSWTFVDTRRVWDACGLINKSGDWRNRQVALTDVGRAGALSYLRHVAAGPKDSPW